MFNMADCLAELFGFTRVDTFREQVPMDSCSGGKSSTYRNQSLFGFTDMTYRVG